MGNKQSIRKRRVQGKQCPFLESLSMGNSTRLHSQRLLWRGGVLRRDFKSKRMMMPVFLRRAADADFKCIALKNKSSNEYAAIIYEDIQELRFDLAWLQEHVREFERDQFVNRIQSIHLYIDRRLNGLSGLRRQIEAREQDITNVLFNGILCQSEFTQE